MDEYRSKSYNDGRMEIETYYNENNNHSNNNNGGVVGFQDLRCYSASYATSSAANAPKQSKPGNGSSSKPVWCFGDPELQRKKRVASYKSYSVEGKLKKSFSKSFRWIKDRYSNMVHGP
ncbi:hypothetical protein RND81_08G024700 [Saponaria officinalis]|uniref:DUF3511 domain protein n=1 Tax=Saponaria officinalis TaxID=3572 RepID=A0AAW1J1S3_SAPOF